MAAVVVQHGWKSGAGEVLFWATLLAGYMFFVDISHKIWWTHERIWWRGWDYLSIRPMRHTVLINELTKVASANHPNNRMGNRPFDRILLISPFDTITIMPSFNRREELEELLRHIEMARPDIAMEADIQAFMTGEFSDWWRYR